MIDGSSVGWLATGERGIRAGLPQAGNAASGAAIAAAPPFQPFLVVSCWLLVVSETQREKTDEQENHGIHESEVGLLLVRRLRGNRRWRARWLFHDHPVGGKRKVGRGREKVGCPERQSR